MKITRDNYESFFIDYIEGNLHESMIDQFLDFLNQNPDLKEELHLFEENTVVAYLEDDLDADENKAFENYLAAHPELKKEYDLFAKTRLTPDSGIKYPEKRKLYRKSGATIVMNWVARAAAVLVLIWGINSVIQTQNTQESGKGIQELAEVSPKSVSTVKKAESEKSNQEIAIPVKNKPEKAILEQAKVEPQETQPIDLNPTERDLTALAQITPIIPQLDEEPVEAQLAFSSEVDVIKINEAKNVMSVEEFLASRAKKMGKEGLFSAQRIARLGLNLASEISGERIGYQMKDGKIASVDFESKLMAFSIPLEKK